MPPRLSDWTSACLVLDQVPSFESTDAISAYWRKVLEIFVAPRWDSFSLSGVHSVGQMQRVACFSDWQPPVQDRIVIQFARDTRAKVRAACHRNRAAKNAICVASRTRYSKLMWARAKTSRTMAVFLQCLLGACFPIGCHPRSTMPPAVSKAPRTPSFAAAVPVPSPGSLVTPPKPCLTGSVPLQLGEVGAEVGSSAPGGVVSWLGKLNDDEWVDVIVVFPDSCSGYGECEHSVYLGCGRGGFAAVYGPEYSVSLTPDANADAARRPVPLREVRRKDNFEEPGATPTLLQYRDGQYEPAP